MYERQNNRKFMRMLSNRFKTENYEFKRAQQQPRVLTMMYLISLQLMFYISSAAHTMQ